MIVKGRKRPFLYLFYWQGIKRNSYFISALIEPVDGKLVFEFSAVPVKHIISLLGRKL